MATWRTIEETARDIEVHRRTIDRWIADGKLKAYKIEGDRRHYVDADAVERLRKPKPVRRPKRR
jgi:excisionase family DNA binding protein